MASKADSIAKRLNSAPVVTNQKEYEDYLSSKNNTSKNTNIPTKKTVTSSATSGRTSSGLTWAKDAKEETDPYRKANNDFNTKYSDQIKSIADYNNVDLSVGREMFTSNLEGGLQGVQFDPYKGGGVATNWDEMVNDWSNLKNAAIASTNQKGRTVTNSYGREVNTSDLLPKSTAINNKIGTLSAPTNEYDAMIDAISNGNPLANPIDSRNANTISNIPKDAELFTQVTPDGGGIKKTKDGKYVVEGNGGSAEIKEVDVIDWFEQLYGF